jgi:hypothetical protein
MFPPTILDRQYCNESNRAFSSSSFGRAYGLSTMPWYLNTLTFNNTVDIQPSVPISVFVGTT